ncbi:MFS transporter [Caballeronia sp. DA-9]|uniref:MFS transporter n=1 Tax=Caballeronia sp. DA-9 TaxID=3436237 RepID=UPI003F6713BE
METRCAVPLTAGTRRGLNASHRWKVLGVGVAANVSFSAAIAGIPTTAVWLRADYHLGNAALGLALGAMGLGVALSELPWGVATDRWGDRPILLSGLATTAAALFAMMLFVAPSAASVPALSWLVLSMCGVGLLGGSVNGSSGRAIMRWFQEGERGLAMSIRQTAVPLGGGIGALILPWLASTGGFRLVYGALAVMCSASGWLAWRWLHEPPETTDTADTPANLVPGVRVPVAAGVSPLRDAMIWRMVLGIGILCIPQFSVLTFATVFLHDFAHAGLRGITATMVALQLGAMIMRVWSGRFTDKHGNRRAYTKVSTLIAVASFVVLAAGTQYGLPAAWLIGLIVFAGICVSAWHGVAYTELATLSGKERAGTALGMTNTAVYVGLFVTPLSIPHVLSAGSWGLVWLVAAACALVAYPLFPKPARA